MQNYRVTLACRNYDRTQAIIYGLVKPPGVDLQVVETTNVPQMFSGMFHGEYDVSEMSLAELVYYASRDQNDFIGIPVFPSKVFRHGFIFYNASSGIDGPASLEGKNLGFPRLVMTAVVWIRGILADEYNIRPKNTSFYFASIQHWDDGVVGIQDVAPRDGSVIHLLEKNGKDDDETVESALMEGKIHVLGHARPPRPFRMGDERIKRLFPDYKAVEAAYFKHTGIFPIMHVLAVRKAVVDQHPDLPDKLFKLFVQSKRLATKWLRASQSLGLVWKEQYLDDEEEFFQGDPWAYGLGENDHIISKFLSYCYAQGVSAREMSPKDLFVPSTWDLTE